MPPTVSLVAIAGRIRGLIASTDQGNLEAIARRLSVDPSVLKQSLDLQFPRMSVSVMMAVLREYAINPRWLLYGADHHGGFGFGIRAIASGNGPTMTRADMVTLLESLKRSHGERWSEDQHLQLDA